MSDWVHFKKSFTQQQEDAIWQYIIDHSKIQKNGYYGIMFYVRDLDDFWRRVAARFYGDYARYDKLKKAHAMANIEFNIMQRMARQWSNTVWYVDKHGTPFQKVCLWLNRKTRDYLKGLDKSEVQFKHESVRTGATGARV